MPPKRQRVVDEAPKDANNDTNSNTTVATQPDTDVKPPADQSPSKKQKLDEKNSNGNSPNADTKAKKKGSHIQPKSDSEEEVASKKKTPVKGAKSTKGSDDDNESGDEDPKTPSKKKSFVKTKSDLEKDKKSPPKKDSKSKDSDQESEDEKKTPAKTSLKKTKSEVGDKKSPPKKTTSKDDSDEETDSDKKTPTKDKAKKSYTTSKQATWNWKDTDGTEHPFTDDVAAKLESLFKSTKDKSKASAIKVDKDRFVSLADMKMYAYSGKDPKGKEVTREEAFVKIQWTWENDKKEWHKYDNDVNELIEKKYQKDHTGKYNLDEERYIDFTTNKQVRFDNEKRFRNVKRTENRSLMPSSGPIPKKWDPADGLAWFWESDKDRNTDTDDKSKDDKSKQNDRWMKYDEDTSKEIEEAYQVYKKDGDEKKSKFEVDKIRFIDFVKMKQFRKGNPDRYRNVCRVDATTAMMATPKKGSASSSAVKPNAIKKTYSNMTEAEKREMFDKLLKAQEDPAPEKKVKALGTELFLPGEDEIRAGNKVMKYCIKPNKFFDNSLADLHFRTAESQFHRLMGPGVDTKVTLVEYIVNPQLIKDFENKAADLASIKDGGIAKPVLAFHGTAQKNINGILKINFQVPGNKGIAHATDSGWYGKGIYFSEYPDYSMGYIQDCTKILLCKVLLGKAYQCPGMLTGKPCQKGYDSHISPCGKELVIFSPEQILPCYVVHYSDSSNASGVAMPKGALKATDCPYTATDASTGYYNAYNKPHSNIFAGCVMVFSGTLTATHAVLTTIAQNHGATVMGSVHKSTTHVIAAYNDYKNNSTKVAAAVTAGAVVLSEMFLFDSVNQAQKLKYKKYTFEEKKKKEKKDGDADDSSEIKAEPLEGGDDSDDDAGGNDSEDDTPPLPECKYGDKCYRKIASHFAEYSHPWLI